MFKNQVQWKEGYGDQRVFSNWNRNIIKSFVTQLVGFSNVFNSHSKFKSPTPITEIIIKKKKKKPRIGTL